MTEEYRLDNETGEIRLKVTCLRTPCRAKCNDEEIPQTVGNRFRVPAAFQNPSPKKEDLDQSDLSLDWTKRELRSNFFENKVVHNTQNISPMVYMLPTLLFFPAWASILCAIGEAAIHIWTHKQNKLEKNSNKLYQSPLSLISSEFCAHCRTDKCMRKISKIQDLRSSRRNLIEPNLIKAVIR